MKNKVSFTYWAEVDNKYLGYLNDYPDHRTQGETIDDLKDHLLDLYSIFSEDKIIGIKRVEDLFIA